MAIIPTPGATPDPTPVPTPEAPPVVNFDGPVYASGQLGSETVAMSEEQLRVGAATLGLDFDRMTAEEHEFVAMFARGALDSQPPAVEGDINTDPIILPDGTPVPVTTSTDVPAATQEPGEDGAGVGSASDAPEGGSAQVPPAAPATSPEQVAVTPPGAPTFDIPSPLPPQAPPVPEPAPAAPQEQMVLLPNGQMVPLWYAQQLAAQAQQPAPVAPPINPPVAPPFNPQPPQQFPTPFGTEYVDERAGAEIAQLRATFEQMQQQQQMEAQRARAQHEQAIDQAIRETTSGYGNARGLTPQESESLLNTATQMGALGMYSQMYPGDPRRAVGAALEMVYWITPDMRQRDIDRTIETQRQTTADVERQKALAGSTTSSPGSVPRVPAPAKSRQEADQGIVAMIEADIAAQNGGVTRR